jgi:hypothetical protein
VVGERCYRKEITKRGSYRPACDNAWTLHIILIYKDLFGFGIERQYHEQQVFAVNRQVHTVRRRKTLRFFL